ncbi:RNA recognition motif domain [Dillenia turbinata]|uniref:RNA recognition motif domain n=1 Tax=Dillenia turbinata TaxID=194707 RepID=A0AAN8UWK6_9MAGN
MADAIENQRLLLKAAAVKMTCGKLVAEVMTPSNEIPGNLDERVSDRVLYVILIQAGRVIDLYIPRDRETDRPKGFAFVEYETEEIADYLCQGFSLVLFLAGINPHRAYPQQHPHQIPLPNQGPHRVTNNTSATSRTPQDYPCHVFVHRNQAVMHKHLFPQG